MRKPFIALLAVVLMLGALGVGTILGAAREIGALTILSPDENSLVGGLVPVTVSFDTESDVKVTHFQVFVDGRLHMTKALDSPMTDGTVTLRLDTQRYSSNQHTVAIRMLSGETPLRTVTLPVYIENGSTDVVAPLAAILSPHSGATVSDKVEITLSAYDNSGHSPIISLFIDKTLKLIKDHQPYSYVWDTTEYANGEHVIEVRAEDTFGNRSFARSVQVVVNNPMGLTRMRTDGVQTKPAAVDRNRPLPKSVLANPAREPMMVARAMESERYTEMSSGQRLLTPPDTEQVRAGVPLPIVPEMAEPSGRMSIAATVAVDVAPRLSEPPSGLPASAATMRMAWPAPHMVEKPFRAGQPSPSGSKTLEPRGMAAPSKPVSPRPLTLARLPEVGGPAVPQGKLPALLPGRPGQIHVIQPGETLNEIAHSFGVSQKVLMQANRLKKNGLKAGKELFIPPSVQVVFDNQRINFDVLPRVQNGKPIMPFRQIFEHTGGILYWYATAKTVRAINDSREIEIQIGSTRTLVNNEPIDLEMPAFIESGRTMVPLTFVHDALEVNVRYNPSTGKIFLKSQD